MYRSSTTASTLSDLDATLASVEKHYKRILTRQSSLPPLLTIPSTNPLENGRTREQSVDLNDDELSSSAPLNVEQPIPQIKLDRAVSQSTIRHRSIPSKYLQTRQTEDRQGGETGLLPLKLGPVSKSISDRDRLLSGAGTGMGATQIHEELGGQLVDVSLSVFSFK